MFIAPLNVACRRVTNIISTGTHHPLLLSWLSIRHSSHPAASLPSCLIACFNCCVPIYITSLTWQWNAIWLHSSTIALKVFEGGGTNIRVCWLLIGEITTLLPDRSVHRLDRQCVWYSVTEDNHERRVCKAWTVDTKNLTRKTHSPTLRQIIAATYLLRFSCLWEVCFELAWAAVWHDRIIMNDPMTRYPLKHPFKPLAIMCVKIMDLKLR